MKSLCASNSISDITVYSARVDFSEHFDLERKPEDHWSYIVHLSAEDMLKSIEAKKFKNIASD